MSLEGKVAVVTGASSGIGEATARALAAVGCRVALAARRRDRLEGLARELGSTALAAPTDITDPASCAALIDRTVQRFGSLDILVNNAGIGFYSPIAQGDPEDWRRMFDVNVLGSLYATRAAVRHMLGRGSGHVVFISSVAGRRVPSVEGSVYAATKHALTAIAEGLRMEVASEGVRVTVVEPGMVRTEFPGTSFGSAEEFYARVGRRPLEAEDVARAVLYAVGQPPHVSVNEVLVRSIEQPD
jgi:NADP-dependent 3-hydroxy acid dehydrogenase YdfG